MALETVRAWLLLVLGALTVLAGLGATEPALVTAGFGVLGVEPMVRARGEVGR